MTIITIDNNNYDLESLSDAAKAQLASLQLVDRRIAGLQEELAIHQTARIAYANALRAELAAKEGADAVPSPAVHWPG